MSDHLTNGAAVAAVASPFWLPWLRMASEVAGLLLPILGVVWLLVQIAGYLIRSRRRKPTNEQGEQRASRPAPRSDG